MDSTEAIRKVNRGEIEMRREGEKEISTRSDKLRETREYSRDRLRQ